jgi:ribosomal protein S18 acetylase RimI-like enzyme
MGLELRPASAFDGAALAALFTAGYEGYAVPIRIDAEAFGAMVAANDLDLGASRVALRAGEPVAFAMLGVRDEEGWIGGMGTVASERRRGTGEAVLRAVLDEAAALGLRGVRLEVLTQNAAAIALYRKLGFEHVRDLEVWTLTGEGEALEPVPVEAAHARIRELRTEPEPWQRDDAGLGKSASPARGLLVDGGAAVVRTQGERGSVYQLAAHDVDAAVRLLRGGLALAPTLSFLNVPAGSVASAALTRLGAGPDLTQHELRLRLPLAR